MSLIMLLCMISMAVAAPSITVGDLADLKWPTTVEIKINPGLVNSNTTTGKCIEGKNNTADNLGSMDMLATLKETVSDLGDKVAKNTDYLDKFKDDITLLDGVNQNIRALDDAVLEIQHQLQQQQVARPSCTVNSSHTCDKSIVDGTEWPNPPWYGPENVLIDSCDDINSKHNEASVNWWSLPVGATGDNAFFEMDLGCQRCVGKITVRNSQNGGNENRGTKGFLVSVASESDPDDWIPVIKGKLADIRGLSCKDQPGKITFNFAATEARYARFEALSYYGTRGPALQFFDMN